MGKSDQLVVSSVVTGTVMAAQATAAELVIYGPSSSNQPKLISKVEFKKDSDNNNGFRDELIFHISPRNLDNAGRLGQLVSYVPMRAGFIADPPYDYSPQGIFGDNATATISDSALIFRARDNNFSVRHIENFIVCYGKYMTPEAFTDILRIKDERMQQLGSAKEFAAIK